MNEHRSFPQQLVKSYRVGDLLPPKLVEALTKLAPERIQHEFGSCFSFWVLFDLDRVQLHPLRLWWPSIGLRLDFQPDVHILGKETCLGGWKMPHLFDLGTLVVIGSSFLQLRCTPNAAQWGENIVRCGPACGAWPVR